MTDPILRGIEAARLRVREARMAIDREIAGHEHAARKLRALKATLVFNLGHDGVHAKRRSVAVAARSTHARSHRVFERLGERFTLEEARGLLGREVAVRLAQWARAKRIRKLRPGHYRKIAASGASRA